MSQIPIDPDAEAGTEPGDGTEEIAPDLAYKRLALVNVVFYGRPQAGDRHWVMIDAGLTGTAGIIAKTASERFGADARPAAIIMTHGHFDHVGALKELADRWEPPVYAHRLELVVTGHGRAMQGEAMRSALSQLARDFEQVAVPEHLRDEH